MNVTTPEAPAPLAMTNIAPAGNASANGESANGESAHSESAAVDSDRPAVAGDVQAFDYTPVPVSAVVGAVLGVVGLTALLGVFGLPLALVAILVSVVAWWRIRSSEGVYGGSGIALAGLALGLVGLVGGTAGQVYVYKTEVPQGFDRVSFEYDVSRPGMRQTPAGVAVPNSVMEMDGKEVFIKGYMYPDPDNRVQGIDSFLLVKDLGDCCFGGQPALTDMIGIEFPDEDLRAQFYEQTKVSVAGIFRVRKDFASAQNEPIYEIQAKHFDRSRSSF